MIRQDYIMRMIEQLVKVLSKVISNKKSGNYHKAIDNIKNAFQNILGLDYNLLDALSAEDIISLFKISNDDTKLSINCIIIAKLFKEKADIKELINKENPSSVADYRKALSLYLEGILNIGDIDLDQSMYHDDVKEILRKIDEYEIPKETKFKLTEYYKIY